MSTSRGRTTRKPASARRRETVGGSESGGWNAVFVGSIVAVVLSLVVLVTVAADSFTGGGGDHQQAAPDPTETATPGSAGTAPPTNPAGGSATPPTITPTPGADGAIVVACGDILAPVDKQHRLHRDCAPNDLKPVPGGPMLRAEDGLPVRALARPLRRQGCRAESERQRADPPRVPAALNAVRLRPNPRDATLAGQPS